MMTETTEEQIAMSDELCQQFNELGIDLSNKRLKIAFQHTSYVNEEEEQQLQSNERLEFLGDAVIDLAISEYLFNYWEGKDEGELSKIKAIVVSQPVLAGKAKELKLGQALYLGRGEEESGGRSKPSILCDTFEALVGLIFLVEGFPKSSQFVLEMLEDEVQKVASRQKILDYKSALQINAQKRFNTYPTYRVVEEKGKSHNKTYTVAVKLAGKEGIGRGKSKKEAEQAAAKQLYLELTRGQDSAAVAQ